MSLTKTQVESIDRVVFVAGGVGINPIMSMASAMDGLGYGRLGGMVKSVELLYTVRRGRDERGRRERVLFEERLKAIAHKWEGSNPVRLRLKMFETGTAEEQEEKREKPEKPSTGSEEGNVETHYRRITHADLFDALGPGGDRRNTVVYICGLPTMTDEFVELLRHAPGLDEKRVLCEKWW